MGFIKKLLGAPFEIAGRAYDGYLERQTKKDELEDAKHERRIQVVREGRMAEADWNLKAMDKAGWIRDWLVIVLSVPLVAVFFPWAVPHIKAGFVVLATLPAWYKSAVALMVSFAFGYRKYVESRMMKDYTFKKPKKGGA